MALKATIFKAHLQIADLDRHYYEDHTLTLARHPSETDSRMMLRIVAFGLFAQENLQLTKGISTDDEPDLWVKHLHGGIALWIELGQPSEKRLRQAMGKAEQVVIFTYQGKQSETWWKNTKKLLGDISHLKLISIDPTHYDDLAALVERSMRLQMTIQEGDILLSDGNQSLTLTPVQLH